MALSFKKSKGPSSSIVSADQCSGSLQDRGRKKPSPTRFPQRRVSRVEPAPPKVFVEELNQLCPVVSGDLLTGGHGHQAGVEDGRSHEAQLGRREIAQERPKHGHPLGGQRGYVGLLQVR